MNLILIILAMACVAFITRILCSLNVCTGWSDEQSQRMLEELEANGEELRKKYARGAV